MAEQSDTRAGEAVGATTILERQVLRFQPRQRFQRQQRLLFVGEVPPVQVLRDHPLGWAARDTSGHVTRAEEVRRFPTPLRVREAGRRR